LIEAGVTPIDGVPDGGILYNNDGVVDYLTINNIATAIGVFAQNINGLVPGPNVRNTIYFLASSGAWVVPPGAYMATGILGNLNSNSAPGVPLNPAQVTAFLNTFTASLQGLVPPPLDAPTNWILTAAGLWEPPPVGGALISEQPPQSPEIGNLWWNPDDAQTYVWTGDEWVQANCCDCGGGGGGARQGVTDGSDAAPGTVGETLFMGTYYAADSSPTPRPTYGLDLPPGDWLISGGFQLSPQQGNLTAYQVVWTKNAVPVASGDIGNLGVRDGSTSTKGTIAAAMPTWRLNSSITNRITIFTNSVDSSSVGLSFDYGYITAVRIR
jgi:hypothetical protein